MKDRAAFALAVPLIEFLGIAPVQEDDPAAGLAVLPQGNALNALGAPHAGALATPLELTAYLTLLSELAADEEAVTHQISTSYVSAAKGPDPLIANGELLRRGKRLAFVSVSLRQGGRLLATAQVAKSIVPRAG